MSRRHDAIGLWWQDLPPPRSRGGKRERGPCPPIPATGWLPPSDWPNLSAAKVIGFDVESYDPELVTAGPGWARGRGHLIGASVAVEDGSSWYFPIAHETQPELNMDKDNVLRFLKYWLEKPIPKVGANLIYDCGWCQEYGINVGGKLYDVQFAEALLDSEAPDVSLESLSQKYLGMGKTTSILYDWLSQWLGGAANDRQRKNLYLAPPSLAGPYAESDAALPIQILMEQWPQMERRGVLGVFDLECRLIPLLVKMRFRGAPVFVDKAEQVYDELGKQIDQIEANLKQLAGQPVNPNAGESIGSAFKRNGIPLPKTIDKKTGNEKISFAADLLEEVGHPIAEAILEHRKLAKVRNTFVKSYIIDKSVNGRIHCGFHPLRGDGYGARSGRFSSNTPNLQNIPVRTDIGKKVRTMFGEQKKLWLKADYSQIEYRMLAHHAVGEGAEGIRETYRNDPTVDYHEMISDLIFRLTGIKLPRRQTKNINFGLVYGMGEGKLIHDLGVNRSEGKRLFNNYHEAAPFVRETMKAAEREVHTNGYVETILGRKSDFNSWSQKNAGYGEQRVSLDYRAASSKWGPYNIERSHTHKALNRKLQGGAADVIKNAMVTAYESGLFEDHACGVPCLTVHDELDFLIDPEDTMESPHWREFKRIMETSLPSIQVPILIDVKIGPNWGEAD